ncbi:MAG: CBS domain-containing protein, partial [Chloroflexi bacterium]|nr:CBS domain-containing protein [Chloroflexota bacterium]
MKQYCVRPDASLIECIRTMDIAGTGIVLAVDSEGRLIGTISDGDIRRSLLQGYHLDSPVFPHINRNCFYVLPTVQRVEVLDIMQARRFKQVPVVDEQGKVVGLHLLHDLLG